MCSYVYMTEQKQGKVSTRKVSFESNQLGRPASDDVSGGAEDDFNSELDIILRF